MTCIIGMVGANGKAYVGADSCASTEDINIIRNDRKAFRNGEFIIACCGSFRMAQLLHFKFEPPKIPKTKDLYAYMCTDFIDAARRCFKENGFTKVNDNRESGGCFIVGIRGHVYDVMEDFQVSEPAGKFTSNGCGYQYAFGSLQTMEDLQVDKTVEEKILIALEAAAKYSPFVREPFITLAEHDAHTKRKKK